MNSSHPGTYAAIPLWLRPITRRPGEVQFGVLEGGPIVTGVTPDEARLLARLDGTLPADALGVVARASGVSKRRWRVLLDLVVRLGLLEPAPDGPAVDPPPPGVAAPTAPWVLIEGSGSLAHDLSHLLGPETAWGRRLARAGGLTARCRRPRRRHRARPPSRRRLAGAGRAPPAGGHRRSASRRRAARRRRPRVALPLVPRPAPQRPRRGMAHGDGAGGDSARRSHRSARRAGGAGTRRGRGRCLPHERAGAGAARRRHGRCPRGSLGRRRATAGRSRCRGEPALAEARPPPLAPAPAVPPPRLRPGRPRPSRTPSRRGAGVRVTVPPGWHAAPARRWHRLSASR